MSELKIRRIEIGIKPLKESLHEFAVVWDKLQHGEKVEKRTGIYFESIDAMRKVLTNKRLTVNCQYIVDKKSCQYIVDNGIF